MLTSSWLSLLLSELLQFFCFRFLIVLLSGYEGNEKFMLQFFCLRFYDTRVRTSVHTVLVPLQFFCSSFLINWMEGELARVMESASILL